jgi:hypothetical protein
MKDNIRNLLICEKNIDYMSKKFDNSWNIKRLLGIDLDQSQSIRFGNLFQDWLKQIASMSGAIVSDVQFLDIFSTGETSNRGKKDADIIFTISKDMYYFEVKTNLNLDSEKSKATDLKIHKITQWLSRNNPDYRVRGFALTCWFDQEEGLSVKVHNVLYMRDFFSILGISMTRVEYYTLMRDFGRTLIQS